MNFESLANELLLDLFEYFNGFNLLRAFYGLNSRLNQLLCYNFQSYNFDFRSISKQNFDIICQEYLPLIINRIISLSFSDDDETPNLPEIFLSRGFIFNHFTYLESLSLYCIRSLDLLNEIIVQCHPLSYLKHLNIINFYVDYEENKAISLMNNIWSLKKLTHCRLDNFYSGGRCFFSINIISSSMKYLSIENIYCDLNVLYHLFEYTPNLQQFSIASDYNSDDQLLSTTISSIKSFQFSYEGSINSLTNLFQNTPNLCYLTLKISDICLNGYDWEKILIDYLPKIKLFRLRMNFHLPTNDDKEKQIDELLNTFRTYFWLEQHRWFVQCDWEPLDAFNRIVLYTLPYVSGDYFYFDTVKSKSTYPNTIEDYSYDRVNVLRHSFCETMPSEDSTLLSPRFYKIYNLKIDIPFHNNFWSCIPSLNQLNTLNVTIRENSSHSQLQLQSLLDRAPSLYSLTLRSSTNLEMNLIESINISIRRLDIMTKSALCLRYFNNEECNTLAHSSLGKQCEVLLISVENRRNIIDLIQIMSNLRSLTFQCKDDRWNYYESSSTNDELIQWLYDQLLSTFLIIRDKHQTSKIHIWIK